MHNFKLKPNKRGFTLVELCITVAMIVIIAVGVISFLTVMSEYVSQNKSQYAFLEDTSDVRQKLISFTSAADSSEIVLDVVSDNSIEAKKYDPDDPSIVYLVGRISYDPSNRKLTVTNADGSMSELTADHIDLMQLEVDSTGHILKCTLHGSDDFSNDFEQSFILTLRYGSFAD